MPLMHKIRTHDTITIGRDGDTPVVVQLRRVTATEVRMCIIAPDDVRVIHGSRGAVVDAETVLE